MPLKRAVVEFGKTYRDRFALRTYPGTSVPIFIFILGWSRTKPRVTLSAQTMERGSAPIGTFPTDVRPAGFSGNLSAFNMGAYVLLIKKARRKKGARTYPT